MQSFPQIKQDKIRQKQEGVHDLKYPDILSSQFCWSIVGQPGSGKTTFIEQMLNDDQFYKDKFDYIFIISPSPINVKNVDPQCITQQFNITWIYDRINYLNSLNLKYNNLLIILDDCIGNIKQYQNNQLLIDLFNNRRHIWKNNTISIFLTTQNHSSIPQKFRNVSSCFTFFSLCPRDLDFIKKELIPQHQRQLIQEYVGQLQANQFLYIRISPFVICLNFKPLVQGSVYVSQVQNFESTQRSISPQDEKKQTKSIKFEQSIQNQNFNKIVIPQQQQQIQQQKFTFKKY